MTSTDVTAMLQPLSARSVVASTLLGTHPPTMPGRLLAAFGERFRISPGTTRVALSRMIDRGELTNTDGVYGLAGPLLERQERQDRSRRQEDSTRWDGAWEQAVVVVSGRSATERSQLRRDLAALGLGELREGVWMRPANLAPDRLLAAQSAVMDQVHWYRLEQMVDARASALTADLFDLDGWAGQAHVLAAALEQSRALLGQDDAALVDGFMVAAAALRHFVHDPLLPAELEPDGWPAAALRESYEGFQSDYGLVLREFFRTQ